MPCTLILELLIAILIPLSRMSLFHSLGLYHSISPFSIHKWLENLLYLWIWITFGLLKIFVIKSQQIDLHFLQTC